MSIYESYRLALRALVGIQQKRDFSPFGEVEFQRQAEEVKENMEESLTFFMDVMYAIMLTTLIASAFISPDAMQILAVAGFAPIMMMIVVGLYLELTKKPTPQPERKQPGQDTDHRP